MVSELLTDITLDMSEWNPEHRTPPVQPGSTPPLQPDQPTAEMPTVEDTPPTEPEQPRRKRRWLRRGAPLLVAALVGGGIAAGVVLAVDDNDGGTRTPSCKKATRRPNRH